MLGVGGCSVFETCTVHVLIPSYRGRCICLCVVWEGGAVFPSHGTHDLRVVNGGGFGPKGKHKAGVGMNPLSA